MTVGQDKGGFTRYATPLDVHRHTVTGADITEGYKESCALWCIPFLLITSGSG
jgi:hypothetical protein